MKKAKKILPKLDDAVVTAYEEFISEFKAESDRAAVILGASKIDTLLSQLVSNVLLPFPGKEDDLLDEKRERPLSALSARISICHRLGIIDAQFAKSLHTVRKIRNDFAHEVSGTKLDAPPYRDQIRSLVNPYAVTELFHDVKRSFFIDKKGATADFLTIISIIIARLDTLLFKIKPLKDSNAFPLIIPNYHSKLKPTSKN
jgi:hypothetical protein